MAKIRGTVVINAGRCKGCNLCVVACPVDVLALGKEVNARGYNYAQAIHPDECIGCASCGYVCPDGCITVYKKKMEV
ncbi:MAG: 4Fe-4S binding protein [Dysgonamonadaceae bacterium]|jgi:2-oxoglutarate ferredoxin oxidoreductase subunit delta|nr:4Fe-4S binding protein [Dysgonamonadaceae bacterium]